MPLQIKGYWGEEIITAARRDRFIRNFKFTGAKIACVRTDSPFFRRHHPRAQSGSSEGIRLEVASPVSVHSEQR